MVSSRGAKRPLDSILSTTTGGGAAWVLTIERKHRVRVKLEQVVFEAAA